MKNQYIEPLISILIICSVFAAVTFIILEAEKVFNSQISASVSESIILRSECLGRAYRVFEDNWNQECFKLSLEEKCSLPRYLANTLQEEYQGTKEACQTE